MQPLAWYQIALPIAVCAAVGVVALQVPRYRFAALGFVAIVSYAMIQDQVSARMCPEYFTVLHPPIPGLTDPTLLGLAWGFLGGWWGGIVLGYAAGLCATLGPLPQLRPRELVRPLGVLVGGVAFVTGLCGVSVWHHADLFGLALESEFARVVPAERHRECFTVACYHLVAYASATAGGVVLCFWVRRERRARVTGPS